MTNTATALKLGVLNMTISFDQPTLSRRYERRLEQQSAKAHVPCFIPKYKGLPQRGSFTIDRSDRAMSPYQTYTRSRKASIQYYREHYDSAKKSANVEGLLPDAENKKEDEFQQNFLEDDVGHIAHKSLRGSGLKYVINRKSLQRASPQTEERVHMGQLVFNFNHNPEESLKNIFTVRPVRTSVRIKRENGQITSRTPITRQGARKLQQTPEKAERNIRPWSPNRSPFSK
jgi:hypothetical protein